MAVLMIGWRRENRIVQVRTGPEKYYMILVYTHGAVGIAFASGSFIGLASSSGIHFSIVHVS